MKFLKLFCKNNIDIDKASFGVNLYILFMFSLLPLYMKTGYRDLGEHKYSLFIFISIVGIIMSVVSGIIFRKGLLRKLSLTDAFVLLFLTATTVSFFISDYTDKALLGVEGWRMGYITYLIMCLSYFVVSRLGNTKKYLFVAGVVISAITYLLAVFDRFSIYLIPLSLRDPSFLSTLGNVDWFMGYYSVMTPLGIGLYVFYKNRHSIYSDDERSDYKVYRFKGLMLFLYCLLAFITGFLQGADSVLIFDIALFAGLLYLCHKKYIDMITLFKLIFLWSLSCVTVRLLIYVFPYNYYTDTICYRVINSNIILILFILLLVISYLLKVSHEAIKGHIIVIVSISALLILGWLIFRFKSDLGNGNIFLSGPLLSFDESFGSYRGAIYKASYMIIKKENLLQRLFGVGPDSFLHFAYGDSQIGAYLKEYWPNYMLENSHNEMLSLIINTGIFGFMSFFGILISFFYRSTKKCENPYILCIALSVWCYLVHNQISFAQITSTPYIFLLLGMGEECLISLTKEGLKDKIE